MQRKYTYTNTHEAVRLVALEVSSALLHNGVFNSRSNHLNCGMSKQAIRKHYSDEFNNQNFSSMAENVECAKCLNYRIKVGTFCMAVDSRCIAIGHGWMDV